MEPKTKRNLWIAGGVLVGGYLIYLRAKHNAKADSKTPKKVTPKTPGLPAASTSGQFSPVGLPPQTYNPYPPVPYTPSYIPPGPGYAPPYNPYPVTGQYPYAPPVGYPYTGYPQAQTNQAACSSVIGLTQAVARQRLLSLGIYAQVVSINGRPTAQTALATNGPTASLYIVSGIVQNAVCNAGPYQGAYPTGVIY